MPSPGENLDELRTARVVYGDALRENHALRLERIALSREKSRLERTGDAQALGDVEAKLTTGEGRSPNWSADCTTA